MMTRRRLLIGAPAVAFAPAFSRRAAAQGFPNFGLWINSVLGIRQAQGAVIFSPGSGLTNIFDKRQNPKDPQLRNMGGNANDGYTEPGSYFGNLSFHYRPSAQVVKQMRIFTAFSAIGEQFTVDLMPPGTQYQILDRTNGNWLSLNRPYVTLVTRVLTATALGARKEFKWVAVIETLWVGTWHLFHVFLNSHGSTRTSDVTVQHFIEGHPMGSLETPSVYYAKTDTGGASVPPPSYIPWGMTGGTQLGFAVGATPGTSSGGMNGALDNLIFEPRFPADPLWTMQQSVNQVGGFLRPTYGGANYFAPLSRIVPIHLTGGYVPDIDVNFGYNGGPKTLRLSGDYVIEVDPSFNLAPGQTPIASAIDFPTPFGED